MPNVRCLSCGSIGQWGRSGRCPEHAKAARARLDANPARIALKAQRYDRAFRAHRRQWAALFARGLVVKCARGCGADISEKTQWDLDHVGNSLSPSCPTCNRGKRFVETEQVFDLRDIDLSRHSEGDPS